MTLLDFSNAHFKPPELITSLVECSVNLLPLLLSLTNSRLLLLLSRIILFKICDFLAKSPLEKILDELKSELVETGETIRYFHSFVVVQYDCKFP